LNSFSNFIELKSLPFKNFKQFFIKTGKSFSSRQSCARFPEAGFAERYILGLVAERRPW